MIYEEVLFCKYYLEDGGWCEIENKSVDVIILLIQLITIKEVHNYNTEQSCSLLY